MNNKKGGWNNAPDYTPQGSFWRDQLLVLILLMVGVIVTFILAARATANEPQSPLMVIERVIDGDTVELSKPLYGVTRIRIDGIDTPEVKSAHCNREKLVGYEAKGYARALLEGKSVRVHTSGKLGKWKRLIARLEVDGQDYSQLMIRQGYAVRYDKEWKATPKEKRWCKGADLTMPSE